MLHFYPKKNQVVPPQIGWANETLLKQTVQSFDSPKMLTLFGNINLWKKIFNSFSFGFKQTLHDKIFEASICMCMCVIF